MQNRICYIMEIAYCEFRYVKSPVLVFLKSMSCAFPYICKCHSFVALFTEEGLMSTIKVLKMYIIMLILEHRDQPFS